LDDSESRVDWGWKPDYDLDGMVDAMLEEIIKNEEEFKDVKLA
jgi:nucleoside-diphosphate-sugar epimerase